MAVIELHPQKIGWNREEQTFSAELSDLEGNSRHLTELCYKGSPIFLKNPDTGVQVKMTRFKVDQDSTGEDTYGFWYHGSKNNRYFKFLFIND